MTLDRNFLRPTLLGKRFDGGAIPLELLPDLSSLHELLVEAAKWKFLAAHPDRRRSPRGFSSSIQLRLVDVEEGSAIPVIALVLAAGTLFPPENQRYAEEARDAVIGAIDAAANKQRIDLPDHLLAHFDRIGRNLLDGEAIEFPMLGRQQPARLDKETRRTLVLASSTATEVSEAAWVRGTICEVDQDDKTFEVLLYDGKKIQAPLTAQHRDDVLQAFNAYPAGQRVLLEGVGRFSRQNRLINFESVDQISLLDALDASSRLEEFRLLRPGWLEGHGEVPDPDGLTWLSNLFEFNYPDDLPPPHLYPTPEGGIRAEWTAGSQEVSVDIDLKGRSAGWHALDMQTDAEQAHGFDLTDGNGWNALVALLRELVGGNRER